MHQATEEYAFNVHVTTQDFCNARATISKSDRQWTAVKFQTFLTGNGITHVRSAPYHPATNEEAERSD